MGIFGQPTANAVATFQHRYMPGTLFLRADVVGRLDDVVLGPRPWLTSNRHRTGGGQARGATIRAPHQDVVDDQYHPRPLRRSTARVPSRTKSMIKY